MERLFGQSRRPVALLSGGTDHATLTARVVPPGKEFPCYLGPHFPARCHPGHKDARKLVGAQIQERCVARVAKK
jgi:hypothetical protein